MQILKLITRTKVQAIKNPPSYRGGFHFLNLKLSYDSVGLEVVANADVKTASV